MKVNRFRCWIKDQTRLGDDLFTKDFMAIEGQMWVFCVSGLTGGWPQIFCYHLWSVRGKCDSEQELLSYISLRWKGKKNIFLNHSHLNNSFQVLHSTALLEKKNHAYSLFLWKITQITTLLYSHLKSNDSMLRQVLDAPLWSSRLRLFFFLQLQLDDTCV